MTRPSDEGRCDICGEPMPEGESMFRMHGYSGPCPKPPLPREPEDTIESLQAERDALRSDLAAARALLKNTRSDIIAVCCDHDGNVCFNGSDGDRRVMQDAIAAIDAALAGKDAP